MQNTVQHSVQNTVHYTLSLYDPAAHTFAVTMQIAQPDAAGQILRLPTWIPGSYMIREFAKNIHSISANSEGKPLTVAKLDKATWQVQACTTDDALTVKYTVYAWDRSVRTAHFDASHAFLNGSSVFLEAVGQEEVQLHVCIEQPNNSAQITQQSTQQSTQWQVFTSLKTVPSQNTEIFLPADFTAVDYDDLIDHPIEIVKTEIGATSNLQHAQFDACGARHYIAITGFVPNLDMARLVEDSRLICETQIKLFEPETETAPFLDSNDCYVFMTHAVGEGYGGLEHRASTALICNRNDLPVRSKHKLQTPRSTGYIQYLGLVSHEYFHTWNVKRIKPAAFVPYDLREEADTSLLWFFEGFTSFYDDEILRRTGLISEQQYWDIIAKTITQLRRGRGRLNQSVALASTNAWTQYYRPDEHSPNVLNSYYTYGSLIALYLQYHILQATVKRKSLDDVMRLLWNRYGKNFYKAGHVQTAHVQTGVTEAGLFAAFDEATGLSLQATMSRLINETTGEFDLCSEQGLLAKVLMLAGVTWQNGGDSIAQSVNSDAKAKAISASNFGAKFAQDKLGECILQTVYTDEPAHRAGLSGGDVLVAIDNVRVSFANIDAVLARYGVDDCVQIHVWRADLLLQMPLTLCANTDAHNHTLLKYAAL